MALDPRIPPIYFILAPSYHGATALSWRLNTHEDILSLGSTNPSRKEDQITSSGDHVSTSPFWEDIRKAVESEENDPLKTLLPQAPLLAHNERINTWLNATIALAANEVGSKTWRIVYEQAERFFRIHDRFLTACYEWEPHKAFVDAERSNLKFMVMATMGFPVKGVIHLVRDPRAYSSVWKKFYPESTVEKSTLEWAAAHTRIQRLKTLFPKVPFLTMKYEDTLENPVETTKKVIEFMGLRPIEDFPAEQGNRKNHLIGLNAQDSVNAFNPATDNWRESLSMEDQVRVLRVAGPLFSEFAYNSENLT